MSAQAPSSPPTISLRPVTRDNYVAVCDLPLPKEQQAMLADNSWSLLEAAYEPSYEPWAIYEGEELVGFMMWVPETPERVSIWRFMVSVDHQGRGLGSRALQLAIEEIRQRPGLRHIEICYAPDNAGAKRLYGRLGFIEQGLDPDGHDMLAWLPV